MATSKIHQKFFLSLFANGILTNLQYSSAGEKISVSLYVDIKAKPHIHVKPLQIRRRKHRAQGRATSTEPEHGKQAVPARVFDDEPLPTAPALLSSPLIISYSNFENSSQSIVLNHTPKLSVTS